MTIRTSSLPSLLGAGGAMLLSACTTTEFPAVDTSDFSAAKRELVDSVPVVDVHTHTFNSRFLPLRGIVLAKRDMLGDHAQYATDARVLALADLITRMTGESKLPAEHEVNAKIAADVSALAEVRNISAEEVAADPGITGARKLLDPDKTKPVDKLTRKEEASLMDFVALFDEEPKGFVTLLKENSKDKGSRSERASEYFHFLRCLTKADNRVEGRFQSDHNERINLAVSHMMDLAPTYNQEEENPRLYSTRDQIRRMQSQQKQAKGKLLYFVAYSPFRDTWEKDREAADGRALEIVRKAYESGGAFGVKVYPPSGYRPAGNKIPDPPSSKWKQPLEQWKARYEPKNRPPVTGDDLDRRLLDLCRWAVKNDVPLFAHCAKGEFEAQPGYDQLADPRGWQLLLQEHKELKNLRLCLGHAGGGGEWYSAGKWDNSKWGKTVYELCRDYKNIYCEFGCHQDIADPDKRKIFTGNLKSLIADSRKPWPDGTPRDWDFGDKIIYGSDWFMPMTHASDRLNYLLAFKSAVYDAGSNDDESEMLCRDFCYRNSLEFLNVEERIAKGELPAKLATNLRKLKSIEPKVPAGR
ncbi:amidohydrolase family protein [Haloferula sp. BvORR071]|uniref:amidohydrolase family protein n=1 Tax=Haloferula sp. BvORR071 TaxID=1396141 RepID=UPI000554BF2A|nr:amidohydrolase family protein [Haloferula sp. BvORR071]